MYNSLKSGKLWVTSIWSSILTRLCKQNHKFYCLRFGLKIHLHSLHIFLFLSRKKRGLDMEWKTETDLAIQVLLVLKFKSFISSQYFRFFYYYCTTSLETGSGSAGELPRTRKKIDQGHARAGDAGDLHLQNCTCASRAGSRRHPKYDSRTTSMHCIWWSFPDKVGTYKSIR